MQLVSGLLGLIFGGWVLLCVWQTVKSAVAIRKQNEDRYERLIVRQRERTYEQQAKKRAGQNHARKT